MTVTLLVLALLMAAWASPGGADVDAREGHWDNLGEDGRVWVPAEQPSTSALPDEDLGDYHNYTETADALMGLASDRPDLFTLTDIGTSVQGRTLWMITVSAPGDDADRARVFFDGAHHGNEVIGSEALTRTLLHIEAEYDDNATMQAIFDDVVLDVVPIVNPDGHSNTANCSFYADCRKNANGVDLNRNYPANWGGAGSSSSPGSATYHGPSPLSEPESKAIAGLLDSGDYSLHASMHSGTELVLWPYGYTSSPPPELALFQTLGSELSTLSGAPHGQASNILYVASGTTMDHAYAEAHGWRPPSFTPEIYGGSGGGFDWWPYFNPHEANETIEPVLNPWQDMLWHLVAEAPAYAPASLEATGSLEFGPEAGLLEVTVKAADKRPFMDASLSFNASDAPVEVLSENPVPLQDGSQEQVVSFNLLAERGGTFEAEILLDGGPAGMLRHPVSLNLSQIGFGLTLRDDEMGSPETNEASVHLDAGPFDSVSGTLNLSVAPSGRPVAEIPFQVTGDAPVLLKIAFDAQGLEFGEHRMVATANFTAVLDGQENEGLVQVSEGFEVFRPQVVLDKRFMERSPTLEPLSVLSLYRNTGNMVAEGLVVKETVPSGYTYWFRDGPVPIPLDPLGSPPPDDLQLNLDGSMTVTWELGALEAGEQKSVRYQIVPLLEGESVLASDWAYAGVFTNEQVHYTGLDAPVHEAV